jgi:hypothetical protein
VVEHSLSFISMVFDPDLEQGGNTNIVGPRGRSSDREQPGVHASERAEIMAQAIARSPGQLRVYGALPEKAARKAGAEGAYGRSVISSRRRLQVADG